MDKVAKNMDSVFDNSASEVNSFDILFDDDDTIIDLIAGVNEFGELITGPVPDFNFVIDESGEDIIDKLPDKDTDARDGDKSDVVGTREGEKDQIEVPNYDKEFGVKDGNSQSAMDKAYDVTPELNKAFSPQDKEGTCKGCGKPIKDCICSQRESANELHDAILNIFGEDALDNAEKYTDTTFDKELKGAKEDIISDKDDDDVRAGKEKYNTPGNTEGESQKASLGAALEAYHLKNTINDAIDTINEEDELNPIDLAFAYYNNAETIDEGLALYEFGNAITESDDWETCINAAIEVFENYNEYEGGEEFIEEFGNYILECAVNFANENSGECSSNSFNPHSQTPDQLLDENKLNDFSQKAGNALSNLGKKFKQWNDNRKIKNQEKTNAENKKWQRDLDIKAGTKAGLDKYAATINQIGANTRNEVNRINNMATQEGRDRQKTEDSVANNQKKELNNFKKKYEDEGYNSVTKSNKDEQINKAKASGESSGKAEGYLKGGAKGLLIGAGATAGIGALSALHNSNKKASNNETIAKVALSKKKKKKDDEDKEDKKINESSIVNEELGRFIRNRIDRRNMKPNTNSVDYNNAKADAEANGVNDAIKQGEYQKKNATERANRRSKIEQLGSAITGKKLDGGREDKAEVERRVKEYKDSLEANEPLKTMHKNAGIAKATADINDPNSEYNRKLKEDKSKEYEKAKKNVTDKAKKNSAIATGVATSLVGGGLALAHAKKKSEEDEEEKDKMIKKISAKEAAMFYLENWESVDEGEFFVTIGESINPDVETVEEAVNVAIDYFKNYEDIDEGILLDSIGETILEAAGIPIDEDSIDFAANKSDIAQKKFALRDAKTKIKQGLATKDQVKQAKAELKQAKQDDKAQHRRLKDTMRFEKEAGNKELADEKAAKELKFKQDKKQAKYEFEDAKNKKKLQQSLALNGATNKEDYWNAMKDYKAAKMKKKAFGGPFGIGRKVKMEAVDMYLENYEALDDGELLSEFATIVAELYGYDSLDEALYEFVNDYDSFEEGDALLEDFGEYLIEGTDFFELNQDHSESDKDEDINKSMNSNFNGDVVPDDIQVNGAANYVKPDYVNCDNGKLDAALESFIGYRRALRESEDYVDAEDDAIIDYVESDDEDGDIGLDFDDDDDDLINQAMYSED